MLDQTKATVDQRRGPRQRGIIGALTRAEPESGMDRRWTPRIIVLSGLLLGTTIDALEQKPSLLSAGNPALINELKHRVAPYPAAKTIVVLDADGNILGDNMGNGAPGRQANFADRAYYKVHRDDPGHGLFIDVPLIARVRPQGLFIAVSRALLTSDGRFGGVVFVALDYNNLRQFFLSLNVGQLGTVTLYRDDGTILLRTPHADDFAGRDVRSILLFT